MFFLFPHLEHPAGYICARYKSLLLLLLLYYMKQPYSMQAYTYRSMVQHVRYQRQQNNVEIWGGGKILTSKQSDPASEVSSQYGVRGPWTILHSGSSA